MRSWACLQGMRNAHAGDGRLQPGYAMPVHYPSYPNPAHNGPANPLHDLLGPCPPLSIGSLGPPSGAFAVLAHRMRGDPGAPAQDILGAALAPHELAGVLGQRKRSDGSDAGDLGAYGGPPGVHRGDPNEHKGSFGGDQGVHAGSPRVRYERPPAGALVKREPMRSLFEVGPASAGGGEPAPVLGLHDEPGRTPPPVEGGLCKRRRTSSQARARKGKGRCLCQAPKRVCHTSAVVTACRPVCWRARQPCPCFRPGCPTCILFALALSLALVHVLSRLSMKLMGSSCGHGLLSSPLQRGLTCMLRLLAKQAFPVACRARRS